jgi:hypothetical protein
VNFTTIENNLRRQFWLDLVTTQLAEANVRRFRASLVDDPLYPPPEQEFTPVIGSLDTERTPEAD